MAGDFDESEPTKGEMDALLGPYGADECLPARQATMPPMDGPVIRQEVKTEVVDS